MSLDLFQSSFDNIDKTNRWVALADLLPWAEIEKIYNSRLCNIVKGAGNKPARMIIGACIIKHKFNSSDRETIDMIRENPYMQYLCGLPEFTDKPLFDSSLFVAIRKRITEKEINEMTTILFKRELKSKEDSHENEDDKNRTTTSGTKHTEDKVFVDSNGNANKGVLKMDATCADAEVRYPVDVDIIHDGCKVVDRYISKICDSLHIRRVNICYNVRHWYLELVKRKKKGGKLVHDTISYMLGSLQVDLRRLTELFVEHTGCKKLLQPHEQRILNAVFDMYVQ